MTVTHDSATLAPPVGARDHAQGPSDAPLTLVEYGDFECPHCGRAHLIVKAVQKHFGKRLRFVFRHFPLSTMHPHAERAAKAAEAAAAQGRFWEMHDELFEHQDALEDDHLREYAKAIGLDRARFDRELASGVHAGRVRDDFLSGVRSGVNGTPTFFINGRRHNAPWDADALAEALEGASAIS
jgi:protein-disulfide isomerase